MSPYTRCLDRSINMLFYMPKLNISSSRNTWLRTGRNCCITEVTCHLPWSRSMRLDLYRFLRPTQSSVMSTGAVQSRTLYVRTVTSWTARSGTSSFVDNWASSTAFFMMSPATRTHQTAKIAVSLTGPSRLPVSRYLYHHTCTCCICVSVVWSILAVRKLICKSRLSITDLSNEVSFVYCK